MRKEINAISEGLLERRNTINEATSKYYGVKLPKGVETVSFDNFRNKGFKRLQSLCKKYGQDLVEAYWMKDEDVGGFTLVVELESDTNKIHVYGDTAGLGEGFSIFVPARSERILYRGKGGSAGIKVGGKSITYKSIKDFEDLIKEYTNALNFYNALNDYDFSDLAYCEYKG